MTSSDPKSANAEGGGLLPAVLAGVGILLVAGLFIFGGDDEKVASEAKGGKAGSASAQTAKGGAAGGVAARGADKASETSRPQARVNPKIANAVVTGGMAPEPTTKKEPTSFASSAEEIAYWEGELEAAEKLLEMRETAVERLPKTEENIRQNGTAQDLEQFQTRAKVVNDNLEKAKARVAEVEEKLAALRGG